MHSPHLLPVTRPTGIFDVPPRAAAAFKGRGMTMMGWEAGGPGPSLGWEARAAKPGTDSMKRGAVRSGGMDAALGSGLGREARFAKSRQGPYAEPATGRLSRWSLGAVGRRGGGLRAALGRVARIAKSRQGPYAEPATGRLSRWSLGAVGWRDCRPRSGRRLRSRIPDKTHTTSRGAVGRWGWRDCCPSSGRRLRSRNSDKTHTTSRGAVGRWGWRTAVRPPAGGSNRKTRTRSYTTWHGAVGRWGWRDCRPRSGRRLRSRNSDKILYNVARCGRTTGMADCGPPSGRRLSRETRTRPYGTPATGHLSRWSRGAVGRWGWRDCRPRSGRRLRSRNSDKILYNVARCGRTTGMAGLLPALGQVAPVAKLGQDPCGACHRALVPVVARCGRMAGDG
jgi:hypothetical protein